MVKVGLSSFISDLLWGLRYWMPSNVATLSLLRPAAFASSVSMCMSSAYWGWTRTMTSPMTVSRSPSTRTRIDALVLHAEAARVVRVHVHVAVREDDAVADGHRALRAAQRQAGRALELAGLAQRRVHAERDRVGARDLDLGLLAQRVDDRHALDLTLRADEVDRLAAHVLPGLGDVAALGELVALAEQRVAVRRVRCTWRTLTPTGMAWPVTRCRTARGARRRTRTTSRAIIRSSSVATTSTRVGARGEAMSTTPPRAARIGVLVLLRVQHHAHVDERVADGRAHLDAVLADAAGEDDRVRAAQHRRVRADVLADAVDEDLDRETRARIAARGGLLDVAEVAPTRPRARAGPTCG